MFDIINAKKQFAKLSKDSKLIKLQEMLSIVKSSLGTYSDMFQHLALQGSSLPEDTLVSYHDLILADISMLQWDSLDLFVDELKKFHTQIVQKNIDSSVSKDQEDANKLLQDLYF